MGHFSTLCMIMVNSLQSRFSTQKKSCESLLRSIESLSLVTWLNVKSYILNLFAARAAAFKLLLCKDFVKMTNDCNTKFSS